MSVKSKKLRGRQTLKGRQPDAAAVEELQTLFGDMPRRRDFLIEFLHKIQDAYGQLSDRHLVALASELRLAIAEVYEVATFYHHFDVIREGEQVPPKLTVRVCHSLTCEMFGAAALIEQLGTVLGSDVRIQPVPCVGRCEQAPVVVVGMHPVPFATGEAVTKVVKTGMISPDPLECLSYDDYRSPGGYSLLRECVEGHRDLDSVVSELEHSGLRGLGGAGFPAGRKWRVLRAQGKPRLMAVNIDEGEPGTFKDRYYLERNPHQFLEGMLIGAWAVEAEAVYIYLRDEYAGIRQMLQYELQKLENNPPCELPKIDMRRGAGAYICGEESAMIESIEGKRGMPRLRPPYVAEVGLFGQPTLEHNMETLYWVPEILRRGAKWFSGQGRHARKGLRSFSVSGRVKKPGVYLAPAGITMLELIDEYCGGMLDGHTFYGYFPGGASGGILPAALGDVPLDFDTLQAHGCFIGSAAIVVFSDHDRARNLALNAMQFFAEESCGQCTPCRVGTDKAVALMQQKRWDTELLEELCQVMQDASICGLGQAAPNPVRCVVEYFPQEVN